MSLRDVFALSPAAVVALFAELRWGTSGTQACPHCGAIDNHRFVSLQKRWRCRHCYGAFSVTSGTVFQHHKLPLQVILGAVLIYANSVKGLSALQLARELDVQHKTAFVLLHKIRETLLLNRDTDKFSGEVEIDGGYMHTAVRPKRKKANRKDRRLIENQNPENCVILVLRERKEGLKQGAKRTRVFILPSENEADIRAVVMANVALGTKIFTDEANGYTTLGTHWDHQAVVHAEEYSSDEGVNENQAESYIARFRRLVMGQIHHLKRKYLDVYANEVAFREDWRRISNGEITRHLISLCLRTGPSRDWSKYWQGNKRQHDSVTTFA